MFTLFLTDKTMNAPSAPDPSKRRTESPGDVTDAPLDTLKRGTKARVSRVGGGATPLRQRLMEMGITVGSDIQVIRKAPFGGPIEISVRGYRLTLRRSEACHILTVKHR